MDSEIIEGGVMRAISTFPQVFLYKKFADFRKSIDGLSEIVQAEFGVSFFTGALFVFMGRRKKTIKILYWDKSGAAIWQKRLEEARFPWKKYRDGIDSGVVELNPQQLEWLLSGVDIWKMKQHSELEYQ